MFRSRHIKPAEPERRPPHGPFRRQERVGGLTRAGGKDHVLGLGAHKLGHIAPRSFNDPPGYPAFCMDGGRIGGIERSHHRLTRRAEKRDRKSTRLNSSHVKISYAVFCLKKKK